MSASQSLNPTPKFLRVAIRLMLLFGLCAMAYVILQSCSLPKDDLHRFAKGSLKKLEILDLAPAQPVREFSGPDETMVSLKSFRGDFVVLNVWATWCVPCIAEIPSLDQLQGDYEAQGLQIIAVSMDRHRVEAASFYQTTQIKHLKLYHDSTLSMAADVGVEGLPISIFYDRQGREIARVPGEVNWQSAEVKAFLTHVIN